MQEGLLAMKAAMRGHRRRAACPYAEEHRLDSILSLRVFRQIPATTIAHAGPLANLQNFRHVSQTSTCSLLPATLAQQKIVDLF